MSRPEAERFSSPQPYAIIGATDPDLPEPTYGASAALHRVLRLKFNDIRHQCCARHVLFDEAHVLELVEFAAWVRDEELAHLVVHCEAGISRSSAIALSLATFLETDTSGILDPRKRHRPNPFVYWRLTRALLPGREAELLAELFRWTSESASMMGEAIDEHEDD